MVNDQHHGSYSLLVVLSWRVKADVSSNDRYVKDDDGGRSSSGESEGGKRESSREVAGRMVLFILQRGEDFQEEDGRDHSNRSSCASAALAALAALVMSSITIFSPAPLPLHSRAEEMEEDDDDIPDFETGNTTTVF